MVKTKIFADEANLKNIFKLKNNNLIKGITTNPSLMRKAGVKSYKDYVKKILSVEKKRPISFEIFADDTNGIIKQAITLKNFGKNVYVKVPFYNSRGKNNLKAIRKLSENKVKLNITAIYTIKQLDQLVRILNPKSKSILSIFAGRIADTGRDPKQIIKYAIKKLKKNKNQEILWASCREVYNIIEAKKLKCHIITVPTSIINKLKLQNKSLDLYSKETSKEFFLDAKKSKLKI